MQIRRLIEYLKYSELANLKLNDLDSNEESKLKVYNYINRALAEVNLEFSINQEEVIVNLTPGRCRYFVNDPKLVRLLAAFYSDGSELFINNETETQSVFTPSLNVIDYNGINKASDSFNDFISLIYLKGFNNITSDADMISISEGLLECVANYVAYIAYSSVDMSGDSPARYFHARYKESIAKAHLHGFTNDDNINYSRLIEKGFV